MNRDSEAIKAGLLKIQKDPMTNRPTAKLLMDAIVLLDWLERSLKVAEYNIQKLQDAAASEISGADKEPCSSNQGVIATPKKRGRPSKNAQEVHDEDFNKNPAQEF